MVSLLNLKQACPDQGGQRSQWMIGDRTLDTCMSKTTDTPACVSLDIKKQLRSASLHTTMFRPEYVRKLATKTPSCA